jgi:hypothetical protein
MGFNSVFKGLKSNAYAEYYFSYIRLEMGRILLLLNYTGRLDDSKIWKP